jgi:hypothetical protein
MNREETKKIMAVLKATYPSFYRDMPKEDLSAIINLWNEMFLDEPYKLVAAAVKRLIISDLRGFPPVIGQIKEQIQKLVQPDALSETEAWALVKKAVRAYDRADAFNSLPRAVQRAVGSPSQLSDWGRAPVESFETVIASNFMRSYKAKAEAEREYAKLPEDLKRLSESFILMIGEAEGALRRNEEMKNEE